MTKKRKQRQVRGGTKHAPYFLRDYRLSRHMTLKQVAKASGYSHASIQRMETGKQPVTLDMADRLAHIYGVAMEDLVRRRPSDKSE